MVGLIVTGHCEFATGICSALEFIAGEQEFCIPINFDGDEENFHTRINAAVEALSDCEQILVLSDLKGGTPFKYAAQLSLNSSSICVAYGINLASLIEIVSSREDQESPNAKELVEETFELLDKQIGIFSMPATSTDDEDE